MPSYIVKIVRCDEEYFKVEADDALEAMEMMNRGSHAAYYSGVTAMTVANNNTHWHAASVTNDESPWKSVEGPSKLDSPIIDTCASEPDMVYHFDDEDHIHIREADNE